MQFNSFDPESQNEVIGDENAGFKLVEKRKNKLRPNQFISKLGTNKSQTSILAVSRRQRVFLGSLHPDTTAESVKEYLDNQLVLSEHVNNVLKKTKVNFYNLTEDRPALANEKPKRVKSFTFEIDFVHRK